MRMCIASPLEVLVTLKLALPGYLNVPVLLGHARSNSGISHHIESQHLNALGACEIKFWVFIAHGKTGIRNADFDVFHIQVSM
jgi:hypothetical protein